MTKAEMVTQRKVAKKRANALFSEKDPDKCHDSMMMEHDPNTNHIQQELKYLLFDQLVWSQALGLATCTNP